jgi:hypothetical protein
MIKSRLALTALVIAGLAGSAFVAEAKSDRSKHHSSSSMSKEPTTTGSNMKSHGSSRANQGTTGQGEVGPGTNNNNLPPASNR